MESDGLPSLVQSPANNLRQNRKPFRVADEVRRRILSRKERKEIFKTSRTSRETNLKPTTPLNPCAAIENASGSRAIARNRKILDGKAVKKDSGDGVHPRRLFGFVVLENTLLNVLFAVPANA